MKIKKVVLIFIAVILGAAALAGAFFAYLLFVPGPTSTHYRMPYRFMKTMDAYPSFQRLVNREDIPVPGLIRTNVTGQAEVDKTGRCMYYPDAPLAATRNMVPQGICHVKQYMLITAYDSNAVYQSVIYVLNAGDGEYVTTILLEDKNHVGGIAFDGERIWIAKSGDNELSCISYARLETAANAGVDSVGLPYDDTYSISCKASFVTFYDGLLWVGVFQSDKKAASVLRGFSFEELNGVHGLFPKEELFLPELANGAEILDYKGKTCLIVDSSYGRNKSSTVHVYELNMNHEDYSSAVCILRGEYKFPPMLEEASVNGDSISFVFESAATRYGTGVYKCKYPVDRICSVQLDVLLSRIKDIGVKKEETLVVEENPAEDGQPDELRLPYHVSTSIEAKCIPTYMLLGENRRVQMLYNPYTARLCLAVVGDAALMGSGNQVGTANWNDTMSKNGYAGLQTFHHERVLPAANYGTDMGVTTGIVRNSDYNGSEKYNILLCLRSSDTEEFKRFFALQNAEFDGNFLGGLRESTERLLEKLKRLTYSVPVTVTREEQGEMVTRIHYEELSFGEILQEMQNEDSRYTVTVTGEGIGGTMAAILVGKLFPKEGVFAGNVCGYAFGPLAASRVNNFEGTNMFNLVFDRDRYCRFGGNQIYGVKILFTDWERFSELYGDVYIPQFDDVSHSLRVYQKILDAVQESPEVYTAFSTDGLLRIDEKVMLTKNCFGNYHYLVIQGALKIPAGTALVMNSVLWAETIYANGYILAHSNLFAGSMYLYNGNVYVEKDCYVANRRRGEYGTLSIAGRDAGLYISGKVEIPMFRCSLSSRKYIIHWSEEAENEE